MELTQLINTLVKALQQVPNAKQLLSSLRSSNGHLGFIVQSQHPTHKGMKHNEHIFFAASAKGVAVFVADPQMIIFQRQSLQSCDRFVVIRQNCGHKEAFRLEPTSCSDDYLCFKQGDRLKIDL